MLMQSSRKYIRWWLWSGAALIFLMIIIGGITRLTDSGLSMSDWSLIMGAFPPLNEAEWMAAFEQYKQFPQYKQLNAGMALEEFKQIFFWEYLHRLVGRGIGIVFIVPFLYFWIRGYFTPRMLRRTLLLFGLGALQGVMGWIMVKSGLVDVPYVSHYRLALHLLLAILLFSLCIWFSLDLKRRSRKRSSAGTGILEKWALIIGIVFFVQFTWGAFTAGLDAGFIYNTFPLMNGEWLPMNAWSLQPVVLNLLENPGMVQWVHRLVGTVLGLLVVWLWIKTMRADVDRSLKFKASLLLCLIALQYLLGIFTLILHVPLELGVLHQAGAIIAWMAWLIYYHELKKHWYSKQNYLYIKTKVS